jgi:molybdopterin-containing oxidoreductase family membrane subunit
MNQETDMDRQYTQDSRRGVVGVFPYLDDLLVCVRRLRETPLKIEHIYSPTPHHEIEEALQLTPSPIRYFALIGGAVGALSGLALATYAHVQWHLITSGKPVLAWVPFFVIAFEGCILLGVLSTLIGLSMMTRLPRIRLPDGYDPRFSQDRFGILVSCDEAEQETVSKLLKEAGADEVKKVAEVS